MMVSQEGEKKLSELSKRANDVVAKLCDGLIVDDHNADEAAELIEQALLRERRLAMEFAETFVRNHASPKEVQRGSFNRALHEIADGPRSAAEKEVGK